MISAPVFVTQTVTTVRAVSALHASGKINSNIKVGARNEIAFDDARNAPNNTRASANAGRSGNDLQTRKTEIFITHNQFGRVWMGAGDPAANGIMNTPTHGIYSALPGFMGLIAECQYRNEGSETLTGTHPRHGPR